jgi:short-subunit dehydrogenase
MAAPDLKGQRALVTGASSGLGAEMAKILAAWGCDLVLAARRRDRMDALAASLRAAHGVKVEVIEIDLALPGAAAELWRKATGGGDDPRDATRGGVNVGGLDPDRGHGKVPSSIDILINNAGYGYFRAFGDVTLAHDLAMLQLNVVALVELAYRFLGAARGRERRAYLLNVGSIGAYQSVPYFASYAASKAYVRNFSEALWGETRGTNVSVTCLSPGGTRTEFLDVAGQRLHGKLAASSMMDAEPVARKGLLAMLAGKRNLIPGVMNKLACFFVRLIPRRTASWAAVRVLRKPPKTPVPAQRSDPPELAAAPRPPAPPAAQPPAGGPS